MIEPKVLIFDLDGTLIDSHLDLAAGVNFMRGQFGLDALPVTLISSYVGDGVRKLIERSLQGADVDVEEAMQINLEYYFANLTNETTLYADVADGIKKLSAAGHKLALLTNKPGEPSRTILSHFGLNDYFFAVIGGGDGVALKPDPCGALQLISASGIEAGQAWMIGDHYTDLAVAENAGIKSAFLHYGFGEERGYKADAYFASFSELVEYFL